MGQGCAERALPLRIGQEIQAVPRQNRQRSRMRFEEKELLSLDSSGFHRIIYSDWGPQDGRIILCVHSLTGNGSDFEYLARELVQDGYRVIAPDLPGRGRSDFLTNPMDYNLAQYCVDLAALLAQLNLRHPIDWI